jgi:hypothetical protein
MCECGLSRSAGGGVAGGRKVTKVTRQRGTPGLGPVACHDGVEVIDDLKEPAESLGD